MVRLDAFGRIRFMSVILLFILLCVFIVQNLPQSENDIQSTKSLVVADEKLMKPIEIEENIEKGKKSTKLTASEKLLKPIKIDKKIEKGKKCFQTPKDFHVDDIEFFADILNAEIQPNPERSIFFHETSCFKNEMINMTARQACAVESAAKLNPNRTIFILFASPTGFTTNQSEMPITEALKSYPNIHFRNVDFETYSAGTPVEDFHHSGKLFRSSYLVSHMSDYLRYLSLFRYGGLYFDLDVVVQQNLDELPPNFSGVQDSAVVAVGAMGFQQNPIAHMILELCLKDFAVNHRGYVWGSSGPAVLTRVLKKICREKSIQKMTPSKCWGFDVLPRKNLYAIHYSNWKHFFNKKLTNETLEQTSKSPVVHLWNKLSIVERIKKSEKRTAYEVIAMKHCPKVFEASGTYF
ncbi:lactosylceramide 4-alpha-galactosyltransferase-like [Contarinia nasturtii]|uniref:lactosylceramide 4-alpha-galactosyltransferase-like n=1 Tax=Contarinia nasturtii TaxID=265458 RepID=UPI0012D3A706|nr:lactosylceramide 4-alpha-galactosyltransferase-like [Contarinia nasturtii]